MMLIRLAPYILLQSLFITNIPFCQIHLSFFVTGGFVASYTVTHLQWSKTAEQSCRLLFPLLLFGILLLCPVFLCDKIQALNDQPQRTKMNKKIIASNIVLLGLVSMFVDMSTEMVYPLVPLFLTATLGASPAIVGIIEGIAESISSLLKVFSGYVGDVYHNKKRLAFVGYATSVVYKILLLLAASWPGVLIARVIDRTGKGIRTAPRDALVAQSSDGKKLGGSFGLHKMLDMAGSSLGALLAYIFVATNFGFHPAFLYSMIPAFIGILIIFAVREDKSKNRTHEKLSLKGLKLNRKLKAYLAVIFVFCLGNSSNTFLLLKA